MTTEATAHDIAQALILACNRVTNAKERLGELDAALGDGDHGISMSRAFRAVRTRLQADESPDVSSVLNAAGSEILAIAGGAMGPIFGMGIIAASETAKGRTTIGPVELAAMLEAADRAIVEVGNALPGDKTVRDALRPAADAVDRVVASGGNLDVALQAAAAAAEAGAASTADMVARVGRASRLGERTLGHVDPGATSVALILRAIADYSSGVRE